MAIGRGQPVNWTRELLERVQSFSGRDEAEALAKELNVKQNTLYSVRGRIKDIGIDGILEKQEQRYSSYLRRNTRKHDLQEQLSRVYHIRGRNAGRSEGVTQYTVTIPVRLGEIWTEQFGTQVYFHPVEEGILIVPAKPHDLPEWVERKIGGNNEH